MPFILPDKLPDISQSERIKLKGKTNLLLISSFGKDEPIKNVFKAMSRFRKSETYLYVTGDYQKIDKKIINIAPDNVIFTGFLDEKRFIDMIFSVDIVLALTTSEYCMLTNNSYQSIADKIHESIERKELLKRNMVKLKQKLIPQWNKLFCELETTINQIK